MERQSGGPSNDSGLRMVNLESKSKDPPRVRKTDKFIVFYLFVLHSVTCPKTCHITACFTSLWTSISVFYELMNAFITCNSYLVPLLEGLCSSNPCRFEISVFLSFCRNINTARDVVTVCLYLINIYHFATHCHMHIQRHTHTSTHV